MIYKCSCFTNNIFANGNSIVVFSDDSIVLHSSVSKSIAIKNKALGGFISNNCIFYYTDKEVYKSKLLEENDNQKEENDFVKFCEKDTLDCVVFSQNKMYITKEDEIRMHFYDCTATTISFAPKGVCVRGVEDDFLYLAFEDGSVCYLKDNKLIEVFKMDENITSFDVKNKKICTSFFYDKIGICDTSGENFKHTKIKFAPKIVRFWQNHITALDEENNFFLLDADLKILYCQNYEGKLKFFEVIDDVLFLIMKDEFMISTDSITEYI